ncbi:MAG: hypothetical protein KAS17_08540 [Victivallaceae bacterium]|nr:hypothetical protein [Victivallaceae bacterium]
MKNFIFTLLTTTVLLIMLAACKAPPEKPLLDTYRFRHKAVFSQTDNLIDDIGQTYIDKDAAMKDMDTFIRKNPRVSKVTLASVPMAKYPLSVSLIQVKRAVPKPIGKRIDRKNFNQADDMIWYRALLRKKSAYWYQAKSEKDAKMISYVYPVLKELKPAIMLYILKLDFDREDNPVLFWNVPKKFYAQELLKQEKKYLREYFLLKEEAKKKRLAAEMAKKLKESKVDYEIKLKKVDMVGKEREKKLKEQLERSKNK